MKLLCWNDTFNRLMAIVLVFLGIFATFADCENRKKDPLRDGNSITGPCPSGQIRDANGRCRKLVQCKYDHFQIFHLSIFPSITESICV